MDFSNYDSKGRAIVVEPGDIQGQANASATVTAIAVIATINVATKKRLNCQITVGVASLSAFEIQGRCHPSGAYQTMYSSAGDFTSPAGLLIGASGDLTTQAAGNGFFQMDVTGLESVRLRAAGTASTVAVFAGSQ